MEIKKILEIFVEPWQISENKLEVKRDGLLENNVPWTRINGKRKMLWLPNWFNFIEFPQNQVDLFIFENIEDFKQKWGAFDHLNIPVWYLETEENVLLLKVICPRVNAIYTLLIGDSKIEDIPGITDFKVINAKSFIKNID